MKKKQILSMVLAVLMIFGMMPFSIFSGETVKAADVFDPDDLRWELPKKINDPENISDAISFNIPETIRGEAQITDFEISLNYNDMLTKLKDKYKNATLLITLNIYNEQAGNRKIYIPYFIYNGKIIGNNDIKTTKGESSLNYDLSWYEDISRSNFISTTKYLTTTLFYGDKLEIKYNITENKNFPGLDDYRDTKAITNFRFPSYRYQHIDGSPWEGKTNEGPYLDAGNEWENVYGSNTYLIEEYESSVTTGKTYFCSRDKFAYKPIEVIGTGATFINEGIEVYKSILESTFDHEEKVRSDNPNFEKYKLFYKNTYDECYKERELKDINILSTKSQPINVKTYKYEGATLTPIEDITLKSGEMHTLKDKKYLNLIVINSKLPGFTGEIHEATPTFPDEPDLTKLKADAEAKIKALKNLTPEEQSAALKAVADAKDEAGINKAVADAEAKDKANF